MIIEAQNNGVRVDLLVMEQDVMENLYGMYQASIRVQGCRLRSGYWRDEMTNEILRLATPEEIDRVNAFRVMFKVVEEL